MTRTQHKTNEPSKFRDLFLLSSRLELATKDIKKGDEYGQMMARDERRSSSPAVMKTSNSGRMTGK